MEELRIEYLPVDALKPYERNARKHAEADVEAIMRSIEEFGFDDPIGVWGKDNLIVEGHGRLEAAKQLAMETVPVIRLDHLTDEQRRAYALAHNKTAELSGWDFAALEEELNELEAEFDMADFGFIDTTELDTTEDEESNSFQNAQKDTTYTAKTDIPQYEPRDENIDLSQCLDSKKYNSLIFNIEHANITNEERFFLVCAASRHFCFNYKKIADYYATKASKEMQSLMEESALVIIDFNDAIKNGYVKLSRNLERIMSNES